MLKNLVGFAKTYSKRILAAIGIGFIVAAAILLYREWDEISEAFAQADVTALAVVAFLTVGSYALLLVGFVFIHRLFEFKLSAAKLSLIGFVSMTINHLLPLASVGGYSMRVYFLHQNGYKPKDSITVSIIHSYFHNFILFTLFPVFAAYVVVTRTVSTRIAVVLGLSAVVSLAVLIIATIVIFHETGRQKVLHGLDRVAGVVNIDIQGYVDRLLVHFENAKAMVVAKKSRFAMMAAIVATEWTVSTIALGFCFRAFGYSLPLPQLFVGFILGASLGLFSLLPGGLGVQEGTMTVAFMALGVPFQFAFLAPILYRVLYYFVPAAISLVLYWLLLRDEKPKEEANLLGDSADS